MYKTPNLVLFPKTHLNLKGIIFLFLKMLGDQTHILIDMTV